jgi:hypothetical protein
MLVMVLPLLQRLSLLLLPLLLLPQVLLLLSRLPRLPRVCWQAHRLGLGIALG